MSSTGIAFQGKDTSIISDDLIQTGDREQDLQGNQQSLKNGSLFLNDTFQSVTDEDLGILGSVLNLNFNAKSNSKFFTTNKGTLTINAPLIKTSSGVLWVKNGIGAITVVKGTNIVTPDGNPIELSQAIGQTDLIYWTASKLAGVVVLTVSKNIA